MFVGFLLYYFLLLLFFFFFFFSPLRLTFCGMQVRNKQLYRRKFYMPDDNHALHWESTKKRDSDSKIMTSRFVELLRGQMTDGFKGVSGIESFAHLSFSLVFKDRDSSGKEVATRKWILSARNAAHSQEMNFFFLLCSFLHRAQVLSTLDLIAENTSDYELWTSTLGQIIQRSLSVLDYMRQGAVFTKVRPKQNYQRKFVDGQRPPHAHARTHTRTHTHTQRNEEGEDNGSSNDDERRRTKNKRRTENEGGPLFSSLRSH